MQPRRNLRRVRLGRLDQEERSMSAVAPPAAGDITREQVLDAYRTMRTIREFEERLHREFATGDIPGSNQGTFLEALNLASAWHLPCIFVVENNGYAEATSSRFHQAGVDVAKRADGFGMPGIVVDGFDFFPGRGAAGGGIPRARPGGGPTLLECKVGRYYGHFEGDQQTYRGPNEVEDLRRDRDCLANLARRATEAGLVEPSDLDEIHAAVGRLIDEAVDEAKAAPDPTPDDVLTDVYVKY